MGWSLCAQSRHCLGMGWKECPQRGLCTPSTQSHEARKPLWGLLHSKEHGAGQYVSFCCPQVPDKRSELSPYQKDSQSLYSLLFFHPRWDPGADVNSSGLLSAISNNVLSQWAQLHWTRALALRHLLSQRWQCLCLCPRCFRPTECGGPIKPRHHTGAYRILDPYRWTQVLEKRATCHEPTAFLRHIPNRILPQFYFSRQLPHPKALWAFLRTGFLLNDREQSFQYLRLAYHSPVPWETANRLRTDSAGSPHLPGLFQKLLCQAIWKTSHLPTHGGLQ